MARIVCRADYSLEFATNLAANLKVGVEKIRAARFNLVGRSIFKLKIKFSYNYQCKAGTYPCLRRIAGSTSQPEGLRKLFPERFRVQGRLFQGHRYIRRDYKNIFSF